MARAWSPSAAGAPPRPPGTDYLLAHGTVVYLRAEVGTLLGRIGDARTRPMLRGMSRAERRARLEELLRERSPHYERAAITVDTDRGATDDLAREIATRLRT